MRIVFMGTPDFAVPALNALVAAGHDVCGVFSQPDKPVGRHQNKLKATPVKECALSHNIPVFQPVSLRDESALNQLRELAPELVVVAAYGQLLSEEMLNLPPKGCINIHSSLLPKYRGAAPINWAMVNGDTETGVTIMYMAKALDAGDMIDHCVTPIHIDENVEQLHDRLAEMGGELVVRVVENIANGTATRTPQDPELVTYAPMLSRQLCPIDWTMSAKEIHDKIRGLVPWPATSTDVISGEPVKLFRSALLGKDTAVQPGTIVAAGKDGIDIACGDGRLVRILELQAPGSRRMAVADYLRGHPVAVKE